MSRPLWHKFDHSSTNAVFRLNNAVIFLIRCGICLPAALFALSGWGQDAGIRVAEGSLGVLEPTEFDMGVTNPLHTTEITQTFNNVQDVVLETEMMLPSATVIEGSVDENSALNMTDYVYVDDISFERQDSNWYISNKTHLPIGDMVVTYQGATTPILLRLDRDVPPYTRARLSLSTDVANGLKYVNQKFMFQPKIQLGGDVVACEQNPNTVCYNSPNIGSERTLYETTLGYIHDAYNRRSFVDEVETFFKNYCENYSECRDYVENSPNDLSYGYRHYLTLGMKQHELNMKVMRNVYQGEGMGGGGRPYLGDLKSTSGGWASRWHEYLDNASQLYYPFPVNVIFHETAHAYGYSHESGWSYGFAERLADVYFPSLGLNAATMGLNTATKPVLRSPEIIADYKVVAPGELRITLQSKNVSQTTSNIKFRFATNKKTSFIVKYLDTSDKNTIEVKFFDRLSSSMDPVYLQIWDDDATYLTTLQLNLLELWPLNACSSGSELEFNGARYTCPEVEAVFPSAVEYCQNKGGRVPTISELTTLFNEVKNVPYTVCRYSGWKLKSLCGGGGDNYISSTQGNSPTDRMRINLRTGAVYSYYSDSGPDNVTCIK